MKPLRHAVIILAAGLSSRVPALKPLLSLGDQTILERVLAVYLQQKLDIFLVVGHRQAEIRERIINPAVTIVDSPDYRDGMFASVQSGVRSLPDGYDTFLLTPIDIPLIRPYTIKLLLDASAEHPGRIIYPVFKERHGHPTGIPASLIPEILQWQGAGGLKSLLETHQDIAYEVTVPDRYILRDMDTLDDLQQMQAQLKDYEIPDIDECNVILDDICKVTDKVKRHCYKVAEIAVIIGQALALKGQAVNIALVKGAALLHDVARGQPEHARMGCSIVAEMGFLPAAKIISSHMELPAKSALSLEAKIVYLADKYIQEDQVVRLEQRFQNTRKRLEATPEIEAIIQNRRLQALRVKTDIEKLLDVSVESIIHP